MRKNLLFYITIACFATFQVYSSGISKLQGKAAATSLFISSKPAGINNIAKNGLSGMFSAYQVFSMDPSSLYNQIQDSGNEISLALTINGNSIPLELKRANYISHDYVLWVGNDEGVQKYSSPSLIFYTGTVKGQPGSRVSLTISPERIYARIKDSSADIFIENVEDLTGTHDAFNNNYVMYNSAALLENSGYECATAAMAGKMEDRMKDETASQDAACQTLVELAFASTSDVLKITGGNVPALQSRLLHTLSLMNSLYEPVNINYILTALYISETSGKDPINQSTDIYASKTNFTSWANGGGFGSAKYDLAQLWVGRDLCAGSNCGASGVATIGALCGSERYSVCEHLGTQIYNMVNGSHELAHIWGAQHLSGNSINVMSPLISSSNQEWSTTTKSVFDSNRNNSCFTNCNSKPVAAISVSNSTPCAGEEVFFYDASQVAVTAWEWNFGDGTTSTLKNPIHVYNTSGTKTVTLKVSNASGQTDTKMMTIDVAGAKPVVKTIGAKRTDGSGLFHPDKITNANGQVISVYQSFTAESDLVIESFRVSTNSAGKRNFKIFPANATSETMAKADIQVDLPAGNDQEIKVGWRLPAGNYWLITDGGNGVFTYGLWRLKDLTGYPYREQGLISITESSNNASGSPGFWLGPYEWNVRKQGPCGTVGIEEIAVNGYALYPNPGNGIFNLELPETNESKLVTVYDMLGELRKTIAYAGNIQRDELDLSELIPGNYLLMIKSGAQQQVLKVVVF